MKKYIQSLVKIVIVGNFFLISTVRCNRQFPPMPPFPYYQDDQYYVPGFVPPYPEPVPVFYSSENIRPPPLPYENYYSTSTQLFQQNKNYHPPEILKPGQTYKVPPIASPPEFSNSPIYPQFSKYKISIVTQPVQNSQNTKQQSPVISQSTNIITKDESYQPHFFGAFNKDYVADDYSEDYSEEAVPCDINPPIRFFQYDPNINAPCLNLSQPYILNAVYGLKTPITLLPSRFPPRIEQFIEKIQNYFSTYTEKETQKPLTQSQTQPTSTVVTPTVTSESEAEVSTIQEENNKKNTTEETQPPVEVHAEIEVTTVALEKVTENAEVVTTQSETILGKDILSTLQPDVHNEKESQIDMLNHSEVITETTPSTIESSAVTVAAESNNKENNMATEMAMSSATEQKEEVTKEKQNVNEAEKSDEGHNTGDERTESSVTPELSTQKEVEAVSVTNEVKETQSKSEEYNTIPTTNEIFHQSSENSS